MIHKPFNCVWKKLILRNWIFFYSFTHFGIKKKCAILQIRRTHILFASNQSHTFFKIRLFTYYIYSAFFTKLGFSRVGKNNINIQFSQIYFSRKTVCYFCNFIQQVLLHIVNIALITSFIAQITVFKAIIIANPTQLFLWFPQSPTRQIPFITMMKTASWTEAKFSL